MTPLPWRIVIMVFLVMFLGELTSTMCFSYLPKMVKSFGCPEVQVGYQVGMIGSAFFLGWGISTFFWGYVGDIYGNKCVLLVASSGAMASGLMFGFSTSFYWALVSRFMFGLFMGISAVLKSILVQVCDSTNISLAFSIYYSAWTIACLVGPSIAGFLVFPAHQYPAVFNEVKLFSKFGVLLPNLIVTFCWIFFIPLAMKIIPRDLKGDAPTVRLGENEQLIEDSKSQSPRLSVLQTIKKLFSSKNYVTSLVLYLIIGSLDMTLTEIFPVFAATSSTYNGLGLTTSQIGTVLLGAALFLLTTQSIFMANLINWLGTRKALTVASLLKVIFISLIPVFKDYSETIIIVTSVLTMGMNFFLGLVSVIAVTVLINEYTPSDILGSSNGIAMAASNIGRIVGPIVYGDLFSWSLTNVRGIAGNINALGFPLNQYFVFILSAVTSLGIAPIVVFRLSKEAEHNTELEN